MVSILSWKFSNFVLCYCLLIMHWKKRKRKPVFQFFFKTDEKKSQNCLYSYLNFKILKKINTRKFLSALVNKNMAYESCLQRINQLCILLVTLLLIKMMFKHRTIFKLSTLDVKNIKTKFEMFQLKSCPYPFNE